MDLEAAAETQTLGRRSVQISQVGVAEAQSYYSRGRAGEGGEMSGRGHKPRTSEASRSWGRREADLTMEPAGGNSLRGLTLKPS